MGILKQIRKQLNIVKQCWGMLDYIKNQVIHDMSKYVIIYDIDNDIIISDLKLELSGEKIARATH